MVHAEKGYSTDEIPDEQERRTIKEALLLLALSDIDPKKYYVVKFSEIIRDNELTRTGQFYGAKVRVEDANFNYCIKLKGRKKDVRVLHSVRKTVRA